jgi:hypothetical protein
MNLLIILMLFFQAGISSEGSEPGGCVSYEPTVVTLKGVIERKTFAGRPNYESIKDGDEPETYWILHINKPICVDANGGGSDDPDNQPETGVSRLQLNLDEKQYAQYKDLVGKQVSVTGKLAHGFTGHHHTDVQFVDITEVAPTGTN